MFAFVAAPSCKILVIIFIINMFVKYDQNNLTAVAKIHEQLAILAGNVEGEMFLM